jgi:hypothetical protein
MNMDAAIEKMKREFMENLSKQDPELHKTLSGFVGTVFNPAADLMIKAYIDTATGREDNTDTANNIVESIATLCKGLSLTAPLVGLKHLNQFTCYVVTMFSKDDKDTIVLIKRLEATFALKLNEVTPETSKEEAENIQFANDAVDMVADRSNQYHILLNKLLDQIKREDFEIYEKIHEHAKDGKLPEHLESIIIVTLQHFHALSENKAPMTNEQYLDSLREYIDDHDDVAYLIFGISNVLAAFVMAFENKAERVGGEAQENFNNVIIPAWQQLQEFAKETLLISMGNGEGIELAINEIRGTNPEVADAIQELLDSDKLALAITKSLEDIVYEAHDEDVSAKLDKFIATSQSLQKVGKSHFCLIFGFMPSAFARLKPSKDEAEQGRIDDLVQKLHEFGAQLSEVAPEESPPVKQLAPEHKENVQSNAFPWLTYSGFNYQPAVQIANVSFKDDFATKLAKYKTDFTTPEHKASIDSHFGQFACALSMYVVAQHKEWANGEVAEKQVVESLSAYQELAEFVAQDKDKSSENHVARLAFLGALLAYTNRNMPEPGKKTKEKIEAVADMVTQSLNKKGVQLKSPKSTNLFGMIETLLGTK